MTLEIPVGKLQTFDFQVDKDRRRIGARGFDEAYNLLSKENLPAARFLRNMFTWSSKTTSWTLWETERGKWPKRFASVLKGEDIRIEQNLLARIGEILSRHADKEASGAFIFSKDVNWIHGSFEPENAGRCWWTTHSQARIGLPELPGGYAVKFYQNAIAYRDNPARGVGRCWAYTFDFESLYIFNAYGKYSLPDIAKILSEALKKKYKPVGITSPNRCNGDMVMYINKGIQNNEGREGGRNGVGYVISNDLSIDSFTLPDPRIKDASCEWCYEDWPKEDLYNGGAGDLVCPPCYHASVICNWGSHRVHKDSIVKLHDRTQVCDACHQQLPECSIHGKTTRVMYPLWRSKKKACEACFTEGIVLRCDGCRRVKSAKGSVNVSLRALRLRLCKACRNSTREVTS